MPLSTNLVAYWSLDEASGDALDACGSNTLTDNTDNATVGAATGKISGASDFESGSNEYFSIADNAALSTGDIDFSFAGWVQLESNGADQWILGKYNTGTGSREYELFYTPITDRFTFRISADGSSGTLATAQADVFGSPSLATWYYVACGHNATTNQAWISVNAGTPNTTSHSTGVFNGTAGFAIGSRNGDAATNPWDGLIDEVGFWKRDIRSDLSELYNAGSGRDYAYITGGGGGATVKQLMRSQAIVRASRW
jgi:hypothetical protein